MEECILKPCTNPGARKVNVGEKGLQTIISCSKAKGDGLELQSDSSISVHEVCRKNYTRRPLFEKQNVPSVEVIPKTKFDFKKQCILCERNCNDFSKLRNPKKEVWSVFETNEVIDTIKKIIRKRNGCEWAEGVSDRITEVTDLVVEGGRYHRYCYQRFMVIGSKKPGEKSFIGGARISPQNEEAFSKLCAYIENNKDCQFSISELLEKLLSINPKAGPKRAQKLRKKLENHYGSRIVVTNVPGKSYILCFRECMEKILTDNWLKNKSNGEDEKKKIIEAATNVVLQDINSIKFDSDTYPSVNDISLDNNVLSESLSYLIDCIISPHNNMKNENKRKSIVIQNMILSAVRPRSFLSPLGIGLSVHLHRKYGSKTLIDLLHSLGVCASYKETLRFEASATINSKVEIESNAYIQYVFDNADHNVSTLDGHSTFHAMGGIRCVTPSGSISIADKVPRPKVTYSAEQIGSNGLMSLKPYKLPQENGLCKITLENIMDLNLEPKSLVRAQTLDTLWASGSVLGEKVIGWNGFMEQESKETQFETSAIHPMPFVNADPNNLSTIYTCLHHAAEESLAHGQSHAIVTFDQPLFIKATEMVESAPEESIISKVVVRLGGFHLLLSFMGAIGYIMGGSGIKELWETTYAPNSVKHMLAGRAYARALRAHLLTYFSLFTLLFETDTIDDNLKNDCKVIYARICETSTKEKTTNNIVIDVLNTDTTNSAHTLLSTFKEKLRSRKNFSRTAKLWIQYMVMVQTIMLFIRAERTGDWELHLYSVQQMLPFLYASGHLNYVRSVLIYIQNMLKLKETLPPDDYKKFVGGYFTIRRSNKFWCGIWSDMTIEQVLMRSMKTSGGLTSGRGLTDATIARWVQTMPASSNISQEIENFSGVEGVTAEQHVDLRNSRKGRDEKDVSSFTEWLRLRNPFVSSGQISSIFSGIIGSNLTNCDEAEEVGKVCMKKNWGKTFKEIVLHRKDAVKTLAHINTAIRIDGNDVIVNSNQIFHRIMCTVKSDDDLATYLQYELAPRPPALFDDISLRKGCKSSIVPVIQEYSTSEVIIPNGAIYTLDGGYLLHHVVWTPGNTYGQICQQYTGFVLKNYGQCFIVFDGYGKSSTKDIEHLRRSESVATIDVNVEKDIVVPISQKEFLSNSSNKDKFITLLVTYLESAGCKIFQDEADADRLIITTGLENSKSGCSVIVGQDTDLLILLLAFSQNEVFMLMPGSHKSPDRKFDILKLQHELGEMKSMLLFLHSFTGCDTTSAIFNKGKKSAFKILKQSEDLQSQVKVFNKAGSTQEEIERAGETFFLALYGVKAKDLNEARHIIYTRVVARQRLSDNFNLSLLPPTKSAAREHSLRVYHQVQKWMGIELPATDWGWKFHLKNLVPVMTHQDPAPKNILKFIYCNCKKNCEKNCSCRRNGLFCSQICGQCAGTGCSNTPPPDGENEEIDS